MPWDIRDRMTIPQIIAYSQNIGFVKEQSALPGVLKMLEGIADIVGALFGSKKKAIK